MFWDTDGETSNSGSVKCSACPPGEYKSDGTKCTTCKAGWASTSGTESCVACPSGQYSNDNHTLCLHCPGKASVLPGITWRMRNLEYGTAEGKTSSQGSGQCISCPAGTYKSGEAKCLQCAPGHTSRESSESCIACPQGQYAHESSACLDCPGRSGET
eukprot:gb/GECG01004702.1/.p1 GENE.gb/GECG01004702.1/~~gb/GECG01004702.1/.p1  ORF type:complete len:158 (+),score=5.96 gb/GECG01004702.1/:1-474(+)